MSRLVVVTGAFGYSGRAMARRLLERGSRVRTLTTRSPGNDPLADRIEARPFDFDRPDRLTESLRGADALVNTYWVRFDHGDATHAGAVENTRRLFRAAREAGVRRIVHVSITNPSEDSPLPYFAGKARLERDLAGSGISHAILRPAVLFGGDGVLLNNIAWALRRLPLFGLPGRGRYELRPIHVEDLATLAVNETSREEDVTLDAVGPESFAFADLVRAVRTAIGVRTPVLAMPRSVVRLTSWIVGGFVRDVLLTRDEIAGLTAGLLSTEGPPTGDTRLSEWLTTHGETLGVRYASELARHWRSDA